MGETTVNTLTMGTDDMTEWTVDDLGWAKKYGYQAWYQLYWKLKWNVVLEAIKMLKYPGAIPDGTLANDFSFDQSWTMMSFQCFNNIRLSHTVTTLSKPLLTLLSSSGILVHCKATIKEMVATPQASFDSVRSPTNCLQ